MKFFILLLVVLCCSCKDNNKTRELIDANISVEVIPEEQQLVMSSLFEKDYDVIVPQGITLADVSKVLMVDSFYVVKGKSVEGEVHLFDSKGNYLETILKRGGGPDEAANVWSIKVHDNEVFFLVNTGMEIMRYSLKERRMVGRYRLPIHVVSIADFEVLSYNNFILYKNLTNRLEEDEYKLYLYDGIQGKITDCWLPLNSESTEYISFSQTDCLYQRNGKIYFYEVFQRGVYELSEDSLNGYISFRDNRYMIPDNELYDNYTFESFMNYCMECPYIWAHRDLYEGPHYILSNYMYKNKYYWNVIDKQKKLSNSYRMIADDVFLEEVICTDDYPFHVNVQDSVRFFILSYTQLVEILENKTTESLSDYLERHAILKIIYENLNEDCNDLIIKLYEK